MTNFWNIQIDRYAPRKANIRMKIDALTSMKDSVKYVDEDVASILLRA